MEKNSEACHKVGFCGEEMVKNLERRWRSKVSEGLRVKIPKDIAEIYGVKKDNIVEWIYDGMGNIKLEIKEMVLREKKAKVEKVKETVGDVTEGEKKVKVRKVMDTGANDTSEG